MRNALLWSCWLLLFTVACKKEAQQTTLQAPSKTPTANQAHVVYHYRGEAYPLFLQEGEATGFVQDEVYRALQDATGNRPLVTFQFYGDRPEHHSFLFDDELEGYDYAEQHIDALMGRRFKLSYRIDELREQLIATHGDPLDFTNPTVWATAKAGVEAIYDELHINLPFPRDLPAYIGFKSDKFVQNNARHHEVLTVWEHTNFVGQSMEVDQAPNTVIWNYGDFNCFTMAANPDLTLEFRPDGNNWNDCISSQCLTYVDGADAMAVGYYRDDQYAVYAGAYRVAIYNTATNQFTHPLCYDMTQWNWWHQNGWGGHMNDQISSIRIKAVWEGCYTDDSVFDDLRNL